MIADTPAEESAAYGCPAKRDTCPGGGDDPIRAYSSFTRHFFFCAVGLMFFKISRQLHGLHG